MDSSPFCAPSSAPTPPENDAAPAGRPPASPVSGSPGADPDRSMRDCFCLRASEDQRSVRDPARRFASDHLRAIPDGQAAAARRAAARRAAAGLGLSHFVRRPPPEEAPPIDLDLVLFAEELGAADLEAGLDILLPLPGLWLAGAVASRDLPYD